MVETMELNRPMRPTGVAFSAAAAVDILRMQKQLEEQNQTFDEVSPGMFVMNERGMKELAEYMKIHGERIRKELQEAYDKLWAEYLVEWNSLPISEQIRRNIELEKKYPQIIRIFPQSP